MKITRKEKNMAKVDESEKDCLKKAEQRGDLCFTLVEQDLSAPAVICEWIKQNIETAPYEKLSHALYKAFNMTHSTRKRKHAD